MVMGVSKVLIAEFKHETNTFCVDKTGIKQFNDRYLKYGEEIIDFFREARVEMGGIIKASQEENLTLIPAIATNAQPGGPVSREMFEKVRKNILDTFRKERQIDGILLVLHGAMVLENSPDGEGELLEAIRQNIGEDIPIMATLDLHSNITEKMCMNVNGLFPFDNYPHTDMYERGYEAAKNMSKMLKKEIHPIIRIKKLPLLMPCLETAKEPYKQFLDMTHSWEENEHVISVSIAAGFPYADIYDAGSSIIAQTNNDAVLAEKIVEQIGNAIMDQHEKFIKKTMPAEEAIDIAMKSDKYPVVLADVSDNPGGGAPCDTTELLRKLIKMKAKNVGYAIIVDPETVKQAIESGVDTEINVRLGGKSNYNFAGPININAIVKTITDGKFINKGPMSHGLKNNFGKTVVLDINGIEVIVTERRFQPWDPEIFRRSGINPLEKQIIVVKSALHYRAAFGQFAKKMIDVDAEGLVPSNIKRLDLKNIRHPIFPLDSIK